MEYKDLSKKEKYVFIKRLVSYRCFTKNRKLIIVTNQYDILQKTKHFSYFENLTMLFIYYEPSRLGYEVYFGFNALNDAIYTFNSLTRKYNSFSVDSYCNKFSKQIIQLFICCSSLSPSFFLSNSINQIELKDPFSLAFNNWKLYLTTPSFIFGSGISYSYGVKGWNDLLTTINEYYISKYKVNLIEISSESYSNKNYGICQIAKDLDEDFYYLCLSNEIAKGDISKCTSKTTLDAVFALAESYISLKKPINILTFNYDVLFEDKCRANGKTFASLYRNLNCKVDENNFDFLITHIHGIISKDYSIKIPKIRKSVIFSNEDYIKGYKSNRSYCYKILDDFLNNTCFFFGNSITDYEEQKVILNHWESNPTSYHFSFVIKSKNETINKYNTIRLLKLGVLPLFFNDETDLINFLELFLKKTVGEVIALS